MIIRDIYYKDVPALELSTKTLCVIVVPKQGGKMVSFKKIGCNKEYLLQNPSKKFLPMGAKDNFECCECAGFDDMFPTIDPIEIACPDGTVLCYPDHGEVCRMKFSAEAGEGSLTMRFHSEALGYTYEKTYTEDSDGALRIVYRIKTHISHSCN